LATRSGSSRRFDANDSKKGRGCRVDRHERIGLGAIGEKGFANLMTEPAFEYVPKILETPKDEAGDYDRQGLAALRRLAGFT
jgi:deoxyribonuclease-4